MNSKKLFNRSDDQLPSSDYSMKKVLFTKRFMQSMATIRGQIVKADDLELQEIVHYCIDSAEAELTEFITDDIQIALFGTGNELKIFFIASKRVIGEGVDSCVIDQYSFLVAIADDVEINSRDKSLLSRRLSKVSYIAGFVLSAHRVARFIRKTVEDFSNE